MRTNMNHITGTLLTSIQFVSLQTALSGKESVIDEPAELLMKQICQCCLMTWQDSSGRGLDGFSGGLGVSRQNPHVYLRNCEPCTILCSGLQKGVAMLNTQHSPRAHT